MTTLARINGEALAVPGLRFWGRSDLQNNGWANRVSLLASDSRGAIELWESNTQSIGSFGGIEVHSRTPQYDGQGSMGSCAALHGDECYADGSSLAYVERAQPLIAAGDSAGVLALLADWHRSHFGAAAIRAEAGQ